MTCNTELGRELGVPHRRAQWSQQCPSCGDIIEENDPIYLFDGEWFCADCAELEADDSP